MALDLAGAPEFAAPRLLGCVLTAVAPEGAVSVVLTEVEAYGGSEDPASHAHGGATARNATMFGPPGRLYVYRSYGLHWCANVVTGPEGVSSAVLLRAGRVVDGVAVARARRGPRVSDRDLARGPGRLCQALGIDGDDDGGALGDDRLTLVEGISPGRVGLGPRVGVTRAADRPWRFWDEDSRHVSAYRRSPRAPAPGQ